MQNAALRRRSFLAGSAVALGSLAPFRSQAGELSASEFGISPADQTDQTANFQIAMDTAAERGLRLLVPAGNFNAHGIIFPSNLHMEGVAGATTIRGYRNEPMAGARNAENITLIGLSFDGQDFGDDDGRSGLVAFQNCANLRISDCTFSHVTGNALYLGAVSGRVSNNKLSGASLTGLFALDSAGLLINGNTISACGNGGIRVFRNQSGFDGTIISENRVFNIRSGSGNGQNGNAINVFRADEVVIANNVLSNCDFSAIRVNSTNNTLIRGNACTECREVAIFSEFEFSGSIIAENIIDNAALGISITNFNNGGHLAICTGNIVRNIMPFSPTNPDAAALGIYAEADTAISNNVVENVPGVGIGAGRGEFLRDVLISSNVVRDCLFGIGASVAPNAGNARIAGNMISGSTKRAISGFKWRDPVGDDLARNPDQFDNVTVENNTIS